MNAVNSLPPYGRRVERADPVGVFVQCGSRERAWRHARARLGRVLIVPIDRDPQAFRWPVRGRDVVVRDAEFDTDRLSRLLAALICDGARKLVTVPCLHWWNGESVEPGEPMRRAKFADWCRRLGDDTAWWAHAKDRALGVLGEP